MWNGNQAAISLTFDDCLPCQRQVAIPVLNDCGLHGTFFAITDSPEYPLDVISWRRDGFNAGHEIGSHSVGHKKAASLTFEEAKREAAVSKHVLENHFDKTCSSFCYPYTDAPGHLQQAVKLAGYKQARGGRGARADKFLIPGDSCNLFNVPAFHVSGSTIGGAEAWFREALQRHAWVTLMFHGVGEDTAWDNVGLKEFMHFTRLLRDYTQHGLWVATFEQAAESYRRTSCATL